MEHKGNKAYFSTSEVAQMLGISRIAVHKKITMGKLRARKIGRNYIIALHDLQEFPGVTISSIQKKKINDAVTKAVKEYKVTFDRLAKE